MEKDGSSWPPKRIAALILTAVLLLLGAVAAAADPESRYLVAIGAGVVLGALYTFLGRLPDWVIRASRGRITADDDPGNISPRIYVPLLAGLILAGAALVWAFLR